MIPFLLARAHQFAPALALIGGSIMVREAPLKCGSQPGNSAPLVAIDGVIMSGTPDTVFRNLDKDDVYSVEVVCMNPQDSTFNRTHGVAVLSVWTTHGPVSQLKATLAAILDAQDAQFRRNSTYARSLADIALPARPSQLRVSLKAHENGWLAQGTMDRVFATCFVFDGDIPTPPARLARRQIDCLPG